MQIKIGLENNNEGRSIAWALDFPGCFAYGSEGPEAIIRIPQALIAYKNWLDGYTSDSWIKELGDFDIRLVETVEYRRLNKKYEPDPDGDWEATAWFNHDWLPLSDTEIRQGLNILAWGHNDLIELVAALDDQKLDQKYPEERWSIRGILRHVANAEWYYLDRLSLAGCQREELPEAVFERLQTTLNLTNEALIKLAGLEMVHGRQGDLWSPRKILRRATWHVLDHCQHIHRLITQS